MFSLCKNQGIIRNVRQGNTFGCSTNCCIEVFVFSLHREVINGRRKPPTFFNFSCFGCVVRWVVARKNPMPSWIFHVFVMLQGEDGKRKPKFKLKFSCFGYNRKKFMLIALHVFYCVEALWASRRKPNKCMHVCWCVCNSIHLFCCRNCGSLCVWEHCGLLAREVDYI